MAILGVERQLSDSGRRSFLPVAILGVERQVSDSGRSIVLCAGGRGISGRAVISSR